VTLANGNDNCEIGYGPGAGGSAYFLAVHGTTDGYNWGANRYVHTSDVEEILVVGGTGDDEIDLSNISTDPFYWDSSLNGNITINAGPGEDEIDGSAYDDVISGGAGNDTIDGKGGDDLLLDFDAGESVSSCSAVEVSFTSGVLLVKSVGDENVDLDITDGLGSYVYVKLSGNDVSMGAWATSSIDKLEIHGSDSSTGDTIDCSDVTTANGFSSMEFVEIYGGAGADDITGTEFRDRIFGGTGTDDIDGGSDDDYVLDYDSDVLTSATAVDNEVFFWEAGDISGSDWTDHIDPSLNTAGFQAATGGSRSITNGSAADWDINADYTVHVPEGYMAPTMATSTSFECKVVDGQPNPHRMISVISSDLNWIYFYPNKRYRIVADIDVSASTDWEDVDWTVVMQLHPGSFPPISQWSGSKNPPIALYIDGDGSDAEWWMAVRGDTRSTPVGFQTPNYNAYTGFTTGEHQVVMEFTIDYSGSNSYTGMYMDGTLIGETSKTNGINHSGVGAGVNQMNFTIGVYANPSTSEPSIEIDRISIYSE
jgi:hypothetical protein